MTGNTDSKPVYQETPGGPFAKGNPGKPKGARHMTTKLIEAITKVCDGDEGPEDVAILRKLVQKAKEGDMQAMKLIFNYVDGMPMQGIELTGKDGGSIDANLIVTFVPSNARPAS